MIRLLYHFAVFLLTGLLVAVSPASGQNATEHWAFQPIVRPPIPKLATGDVTQKESLHPIDVFLDVELRRHNLTPAPAAPRSILLRRVYLDLVGLPPARTEMHAFLAEQDPAAALESVIERLLDSPQHGERWARHWMDVWRYSDWFGSEGKDRITNALPHLWHWRDWIVESILAGKGYDRMILEMLAADEISPGDRDALRATGFLVRNRYRLDRNVPLMATVEHTGRAFLGLTLDCARCHEHKSDPISHRDYFRFRAFFEPMGFRTDRLPGHPDISTNGLPRVYDAALDAVTYLFEKGDERRPVKGEPLSAALPEFFRIQFRGGNPLSTAVIDIPPEESNPFLKDWVGDEEVGRLESEIAKLEKSKVKKPEDKLAASQLAAARVQLKRTRAVLTADRLKREKETDAEKYSEAARAAALAEREFTIAKAEENIVRAGLKAASFRERLKTDPSKKAQLEAAEKEAVKFEKELEKARQSKPANTYVPLGEVYPETSTGRRRALARWLVSNENPLTARVAVNHIWMRHFGEPLVPTVSDFGLSGKPPTHPELLDWLAAEFIESGWDMKHMHRLILTSAAWQRSSSNASREPNLAIDPENRFLWRMNPRRMEAEVVRDSLLCLAGLLDLERGGPELPAKDADKIFRRSLYFKHSGVDVASMLAEFDSASVIECYRRRESVVPQQALTLTNSPLAKKASRLIARGLSTSLEEVEFITAAYETMLSRRPTPEERRSCSDFLREQAKLLGDPDKLTSFSSGAKTVPPPSDDPQQRVRENLVHVLLNHNDYVTIR